MISDILPVVLAAIECPTHSIVDAALRSLPGILPVLDFSTIKNELFPPVAAVFSRTNSLAIKVRGLQSFVILCGGSADAAADDGLNGLTKQKTSSSTALDKYTMQEKIVPLVRGIKTKEPAVMIAALNVLRIVGQVADADFVAMDILPILWNMSLGPLLNLKQFQTFMELIKLLSKKVEEEQTKKLQELNGNSSVSTSANDDFLSFGGVTGTGFDSSNGATEDDFEFLVKGRSARTSTSANNGFGWDDTPATASVSRSGTSTPQAPSFSWSTPAPSQPTSPPTQASNVRNQKSTFRTVTPDLGRFETLTPSSTQFSKPLQPTASSAFQPPPPQTQTSTGSSINWPSAGTTGSAAGPLSNPWASTGPSHTSAAPNYSSMNASSSFGSTMSSMNTSMSNMSMGQQRPAMSDNRGTSFSLAPPPGSSSGSGFGISPIPAQSSQQSMSWGPTGSSGTMGGMGGMSQQQQQPQQKSGLDKYESLL